MASRPHPRALRTAPTDPNLQRLRWQARWNLPRVSSDRFDGLPAPPGARGDPHPDARPPRTCRPRRVFGV